MAVSKLFKSSALYVSLAITFALVAGVLTLQYLGDTEKRVIKSYDNVNVLVSKDIVPKGTSLRSALDQGIIEQVQYPVKSRPDGSFEAVDSTNEKLLALSEIGAGQVLFKANFGTKVLAEGDIAIPAGKLAITIQTSYETRVGSFIHPGSNIILFATTNPTGTTGSRETRTLVRNVLVLAVGTQSANSKPSAAPDKQIDNYITVAVTQREAEKIVHAAKTMTIYTGLLSENSTTFADDGVSDKTIFG